MARFKHINRKLKLIKLNKLTKWAPFWTVPKMYGKNRRVHPGRHTFVKRHWKRTKTKA